MNRALHFLGYRARSRSEVRGRLRRYGYGEETVGAVIGRLEERLPTTRSSPGRWSARKRAGTVRGGSRQI